MNDNMRFKNSRWPWFVLTGLLAAGLLAGGYWYYRHEARSIRTAQYNELRAISSLKIGQISAWRANMISEARIYSSTPLFRKEVERWLGDPADARVKDEILKRSELIRKNDGFENVILVSAGGDIKLSSNPQLGLLDQHEKRLVDMTLLAKDVVFGDFFICQAHGGVHIDVMSPVMGEGGQPLAVLILRISPNTYLFPLIESWPTPSRSAETMLVHREGGQVVFLNQLRHHHVPAMSLHLPLSQTLSPAVQAVLGHEGVFDGIDYRGKAVLADIRRVPDSSWFIVTKVDASELLARIHYVAGVIGVIVFTLLLLSLFGAGFIYKHQKKNIYRQLYLSEKGRAEALEEFQTTIYSIGDGVITTDSDGRIRQMNPTAEALTGWSEAEARGRAISDIFCIINEETRDRVENPVSRVLREGKVIGLANHTILISRDGVERPIADSGAPIRSQEGEVIGVVLVFSDQTEARRLQKALRESEETYRLLFEHAPLGLVHFNGQGVITACNDAFVKIIGSSRQVLLGLNMLHLPDKKVVEAVQDAINRRPGIYEGEYHSVTADKKTFVRAIFTSVISCDGRFIGGLGIVEDITERKRVENSVIEERNKLTAVMDALVEGITVQDKDFRILYQNPAHIKMQGDHLGELCYRAYHGRDAVCDGCLLAKSFDDGGIHRREICADTANGKDIYGDNFQPSKGRRGRYRGWYRGGPLHYRAEGAGGAASPGPET
jgi:PAS domain S-box-containing protein